jgi:peroxiredoxin
MNETKRIEIGDKAPDFTLKDQHNKEVDLSALKGKKVLLSFHPLAWTKVCARQMQSLENNTDTFRSLNTIPLGVSVDTVPSKHAWARELRVKQTRLLSDFWPHGDVAQLYGLFRDENGFSERANVIIDEKQEVVFVKIYDIPQLPDIDEIIDFLKK